jgi:hypothetical protein
MRLSDPEKAYLYELAKADVVRVMIRDSEAIAPDFPGVNPLAVAMKLVEAVYVDCPRDEDLADPVYLMNSPKAANVDTD